MKRLLLLLSLISIFVFTLFSYTVAKERWQNIDFDFMVKLQDHISPRFDDKFSILSLLGSVEVTFGIALIMIILALLRFRWMGILGWLMLIPATAAEVFGKLVLYHPGPPVFFHRTNVFTNLPSFYVHAEFSYPSGHMTRSVFIVTVFLALIVYSRLNFSAKFFSSALLIGLIFLMGLSRISLGEHWLSDVIGGTILGMGFGFFASVLLLANKKG
jgi:undecaprenyl-diphosphatase